MPAVSGSFICLLRTLFFKQKNWKLAEWKGFCPFEEDTVVYNPYPLNMNLFHLSCNHLWVDKMLSLHVTKYLGLSLAELRPPSPCFLAWVWLQGHPPHLYRSPRLGLLLLLSSWTWALLPFVDKLWQIFRKLVTVSGFLVFECWRELELVWDFLNFQWAKGMQLCYAEINPVGDVMRYVYINKTLISSFDCNMHCSLIM